MNNQRILMCVITKKEGGKRKEKLKIINKTDMHWKRLNIENDLILKPQNIHVECRQCTIEPYDGSTQWIKYGNIHQDVDIFDIIDDIDRRNTFLFYLFPCSRKFG